MTVALAMALARLAGGSAFFAIHAQQFSLEAGALIADFDDLDSVLQCGHLGASVLSESRRDTCEAQQTVPAHSAAHTPGAIAFTNSAVASTKRVIVAKAMRGITTVNIEHYRHVASFLPSLRGKRLGG